VHVLFVIDTWGLIGGTERHAQVVVPALLRCGHRVTVLCREDQKPDFADATVIEFPSLEGQWMSRADRSELGSRVRALEPDVVFLSALRNIHAAEALTEIAPVVRYVHDHTLFCPGLNKFTEDGETCREPMGIRCLQRYWLGSGCVCFKKDRHKNRFLDPLRDLHIKARELEVAKRSSCVLTNSHYMRNELLSVGFHPETTSVLYIFTDSNSTAQPAGELPEETAAFLAQSDEPLVFTPARLTLPDKGVDYLLTMLGQLQTSFRATVAGTGPAEQWLREKARQEGVGDRVHFAGWMSSAEIETLYSRARVVVCPSIWDEPFGLVGIEAMAHEKPVVAFDVGGIPEWLQNGVNGYLLPPKDTGAMAAAVDRLLDDELLARTIGRNGFELMSERFPRARHIEEFQGHLMRAAGLPPVPSSTPSVDEEDVRVAA
jgi:glycosyltransferase involved in cell wall biosynthesis